MDLRTLENLARRIVDSSAAVQQLADVLLKSMDTPGPTVQAASDQIVSLCGPLARDLPAFRTEATAINVALKAVADGSKAGPQAYDTYGDLRARALIAIEVSSVMSERLKQLGRQQQGLNFHSRYRPTGPSLSAASRAMYPLHASRVANVYRVMGPELRKQEQAASQTLFSGVTFSPTLRGPIGVVDAATQQEIRGWALDPDQPEKSIKVHIYIGGPAGQGVGHQVSADQSRRDVNVNLRVPGNHGFRFRPPPGSLQPGPNAVFVYALDSHNVVGLNTMLMNSPAVIVNRMVGTL